MQSLRQIYFKRKFIFESKFIKHLYRYSFCVSWSEDANISMSLVDLATNLHVVAVDQYPYGATTGNASMPSTGEWLFGAQRDQSGYEAYFSGAIQNVCKSF